MERSTFLAHLFRLMLATPKLPVKRWQSSHDRNSQTVNYGEFVSDLKTFSCHFDFVPHSKQIATIFSHKTARIFAAVNTANWSSFSSAQRLERA
jgi:hypothetical protein